jgi:hypothetical protein
MKNNKHKNKKIIVGVAWICVALVSSVYALDCTQGQADRCYNGPFPVKFPGFSPPNTWNTADCCTTACMILNPSNSDAAGECSADCIADIG